MIPRIYDDPEGGIILEFDLENGMAIRIMMEDEVAQQMIYLVQNKLDARI